MPSSLLSQYSLRNGASVPSCWVTLYWRGVSFCLSSASSGFLNSSIDRVSCESRSKHFKGCQRRGGARTVCTPPARNGHHPGVWKSQKPEQEEHEGNEGLEELQLQVQTDG